MSTSRARRARRTGLPYRPPVATACPMPARAETVAALREVVRRIEGKPAPALVAVPEASPEPQVRGRGRRAGFRCSPATIEKMRRAKTDWWARRKRGDA